MQEKIMYATSEHSVIFSVEKGLQKYICIAADGHEDERSLS
jgi:hypothetical protein